MPLIFDKDWIVTSLFNIFELVQNTSDELLDAI
jgi:hypothetical protein